MEREPQEHRDQEKALWKLLKKTRQRQLVSRILQEAKGPLSAAEIYLAMEKQAEGEHYAISTVYRALSAFEEKGFVIKCDMPDADMAAYEWNDGGHIHYAICRKCRRRIPLSGCPFEKMQGTEIEGGQFQVTGHRVEIYGYCQKCREN